VPPAWGDDADGGAEQVREEQIPAAQVMGHCLLVDVAGLCAAAAGAAVAHLA
jgi:hypothetical protein